MSMEATQAKKYYVYELAYPKSMGGAVFYVGKGTIREAHKGTIERIDQHEQQALQPLEVIKKRGRNVEKCQTIQSIWAAGEQVVKRKVYETDRERDAYAWESKLIEEYGVENLTNKPFSGKYHSDGFCTIDSTHSTRLEPPVQQYKPGIRLKVKEIARRKGISQRQLAKLADMDVRHIQRILQDSEYSVTLKTLDRLAQALQVDASLLIESNPSLPKVIEDVQAE